MSEYNCSGPHGLHTYPAPLLHPPPLGHETPNQNIAHSLLPSHGHLSLANINNTNLAGHNSHITDNTVSSNTTPANITDRCRFCGEELPYDAFTIMAHFNNHFRQSNNSDVLNNPCSYESTTTVDSRVPVNNNPLYMHNQSAEVLNSQPNLAHLISQSHLNGNSSDISLQGLHNFPYTYSPQTEPSNLSVPANNMKCSDNSPSNNLRLNNNVCMDNEHPESSSVHGGMSNRGGTSQEEVPTNLSSVKNSPSHQQQNLGCNHGLLGEVPSAGHLDSPLANNNSGHRCSPLNLTGRPKLETSAPLAPSLTPSGSHIAPQLHPQPCGMPPLTNATLHHHDLQHHGQPPSNIAVPSLLSNTSSHPVNAAFLNNYSVPHGYFGSSCLYNSGNGNHPIPAPQLPSCRLQQNFSHSLENVGLSIPVLSPHLGSVHQEDMQQSSGTLNNQHGPPQGASPEAPRSHTSGLPLHAALTDQQSGVQLSMCNIVEAGVSPHQNGTQTECSVAMNLSENHGGKRIFHKASDTLYQCFACRQSFSNVLVYQNHLMCHFNYVRTDSCKMNNNTFVKSCIEGVQGHSTTSSRTVPPAQASTCQPMTVGCVFTSGITTPSLSAAHVTSVPSSRVVASSYCNSGSMTSPNGSSLVTTSPSQSVHSSPLSSATAKPYKCSICNHEFSAKEQLREHFKEHEAAKPFHCDTCGIGVSNLRALKRHKLTHTGLKPYKCDTCSKCFLQKTDLARHMNVHERPKYLTCEHCKRTFTAVSSFKNHKCKGVKEVMPYLCHICGDGCSNRLAWSYHMWKHTKNPMFVPFQENLLPVGNA